MVRADARSGHAPSLLFAPHLHGVARLGPTGRVDRSIVFGAAPAVTPRLYGSDWAPTPREVMDALALATGGSCEAGFQAGGRAVVRKPETVVGRERGLGLGYATGGSSD